MKKWYFYFRTNTGKLYKCTSILTFDKWAEENNVKDWWVVQFIDNRTNIQEVM